MTEQILVVSCGKPYDFQPEGGGANLSGCTMHYLMTSNVNIPIENDGVLGVAPGKESMPVDFYNRAKLAGLPCYADAEFGMKNSGGKTILYIKGLDFVKVPEKFDPTKK